MTTVNFAKALQDAKSASFEALPVGSYDVEVESATATRSSNDKPMIKVTMRVLDGPYARRPVMNNFVMSLENPTALAIFFRHMKCFGLNDDFFAALGASGSLEPVAHALVGRRVKLQLGHRQWQGETRNEVLGISPYTGAPRLQDPTGELGMSVFAPNGPSPTPPGQSTPPSTPAPPPVVPQPVAVTTSPVQVTQPAPTPSASGYAPTVVTGPAVVAVPTGGSSEASATPSPSPATSDAAPTTSSEPPPAPELPF